VELHTFLFFISNHFEMLIPMSHIDPIISRKTISTCRVSEQVKMFCSFSGKPPKAWVPQQQLHSEMEKGCNLQILGFLPWLNKAHHGFPKIPVRGFPESIGNK
jgi:hypothetical protein